MVPRRVVGRIPDPHRASHHRKQREQVSGDDHHRVELLLAEDAREGDIRVRPSPRSNGRSVVASR